MKRIFHLFVFLAVMNIDLPAQQLGTLTSANQQLIEDAVKSGIFIVHRSYRLQDTTVATPTFFGWQNRNYFGETYSLGIKVKEGYYFTDKAVRPWKYDSKFEEHADSKKFAPVLSASEYRMLGDTSYNVLPNGNILTMEISTDRVYLTQDTALFHQKGFSVDERDGIKKGWLAWLVTDQLMEEENLQTPSFVIYRSELTFEQGKEKYEIRDPATNKHILGGFYILPEITDIGQISFRLAGLAHHEDGKWHVVRVKHSTNTDTQQSQPTESGLTPIVTESDNNTGTEQETGRNRRFRRR